MKQIGEDDMGEPINKTLLYTLDPEETYTYNTHHGTEYPYNGFPPGIQGKRYKKTRFINWEPIPEDIIIRHCGSQVFMNFMAVFPNNQDVIDPNIQIFQLRSKKVDIQNYICEQINFFCALYDDDNELITNMLIAKYVTDSGEYNIRTFDEYHKKLFEILFTDRVIDKIRKMVEENDVGDDVIGLFPEDCLRDIYMVSFMIKVMRLYIEHFIISTGNVPKDLYELFATTYTHAMNHINPNMYVLLYNYVNKNVAQSISSNSNIYDMQAIEGFTAPTIAQAVMRKNLLCDGLIKLTFASSWDKINKRPVNSCVGFIKSVVNQALILMRRNQLRYSLVNVDDPAQLLSETVSSSSPISAKRSMDPGKFQCVYTDLNIIIGRIVREIDVSPVDYYLENLPQMNDLSRLLISTVLYNEFHSSIDIDVLNMKQKYILLLYVRYRIMTIFGITEEMTVDNDTINILMGKTVNATSKQLSQKDINGVKKYVKLNNLKQYMLSEKNVTSYIECIMNCVLSSYTIVNHNDPSLLGTPLVYETTNMTLSILDMVVALFESICRGE
ncbi:MAG: hypothetical protein IKU29_00730 [Parabacteroides sp.]|nr:hypothetical protein [Parabacteroides sp.]